MKDISEDELSQKSILFFFPITAWVVLFELIRHYIFHRERFPLLGNEGLLSITLFPLLMMIPIIPIHELLHAIIYPKGSTSYIFFLKETGGLCIISDGKISRNRYIFMTLFPALILGIIPEILLIFYNGQSPLFINTLFMSSYFSLLSASGDFYNTIYILKRVPSKSYIVNSGSKTYYFEY